jgi:hypothetical protein
MERAIAPPLPAHFLRARLSASLSISLSISLAAPLPLRHNRVLRVCLIVVQSSAHVLPLGVGYVAGGVAPYFSDISTRRQPVVPGC